MTSTFFASLVFGGAWKDGLVAGLPLDPTYTGKAVAAVARLAGEGRLGRDGPVVFLHTGRAAALFALDAWSGRGIGRLV